MALRLVFVDGERRSNSGLLRYRCETEKRAKSSSRASNRSDPSPRFHIFRSANVASVRQPTQRRMSLLAHSRRHFLHVFADIKLAPTRILTSKPLPLSASAFSICRIELNGYRQPPSSLTEWVIDEKTGVSSRERITSGETPKLRDTPFHADDDAR
jgi:hypothetical protein